MTPPGSDLTAAGSGQVGPYRVLGELGRGGMGVVYRAHDPGLDRVVALKLLPLGGAGAQEVARTRLEARATASLRHPGIVRVLGAGEHGSHLWVAMELVEGEPLGRRLEGGPLAAPVAARLGLALARALEHAHARGVVHRDLKPDNVLLQADGTPVLIDFGLAKLLGRASLALSVTGEVLGTPSYMAPEQVRGGGGIGPWTDVYGLGATVYHALSGRPPVEGGSLLERLERVLSAEPDLAPVRRVAPGLASICARCLAKDPARRYPSARAVADALEEWLATRGRGGLSARHRLLAGLLVALPPLFATAGWRLSAGPPVVGGDVASPSAVPLSPRVHASDRLAEARQRALAGDAAGAEHAFADAIAADPDWAAPWLARGRWKTARDQPGSEDLRRATELDPTSGEAWRALSAALAWQGDEAGARAALERAYDQPGWRALRQAPGQLPAGGDRLAERLDLALAEAAGDPWLWCLRAERHLARGDLELVAADVEAALSLDPACFEGLLLRARLHHARGAPTAAREALAAALNVYPGALEAWALWCELETEHPLVPARVSAAVRAVHDRGPGPLLVRAEAEADPDRRRELLAQAVEEHPHNELARLFLARVMNRAGRPVEALEHLSWLRRRAPTEGVHHETAFALVALTDFRGALESVRVQLRALGSPSQTAQLLEAEALLGLGALEEAAAAFQRAGEVGPLTPLQERQRALVLLYSGQVVEAARVLTRVVPLLPGEAQPDGRRSLRLAQSLAGGDSTGDPWYELACDLAPRDLRVTEQLLRRALAQAPGHVRARALLGQVRCEGGERAGLEDLRQAMQDAPQDALVQGRGALALALTGDGAGALARADAALRLDPGQAEARLARAYTALAQGDAESALEELHARRGEAYPLTWARMSLVSGQAQRSLGAWDNALQDLRAALTHYPRDPQLLLQLGLILSARGELEPARRLLDLGLEVAPGDPQLLALRGSVRCGLLDFRGGLADLEAALVHGPQYEALLARATALRSLGWRHQALSDVEEALRHWPGLVDLLVLRGVLREELGEPGAGLYLEQARAIDPQRASQMEARLRR